MESLSRRMEVAWFYCSLADNYSVTVFIRLYELGQSWRLPCFNSYFAPAAPPGKSLHLVTVLIQLHLTPEGPVNKGRIGDGQGATNHNKGQQDP